MEGLRKEASRLREQVRHQEKSGLPAHALQSRWAAVEKEWEDCSEALRDLENYEIWIGQGRLPRILIALLAGAGLAVSGAIFQGLVLNPLASSGTLGVSGGAAAGASLFMVLGAGTSLAHSALG
ncbi:MAG: iron chelate uptake ABC transporter family permease subunit, partial [Candidatus Latescibacteria bacterium]|nr:iron chelate uptake ABC transporter family permease subunit [Candidatus Latescibacterota bacterium]